MSSASLIHSTRIVCRRGFGMVELLVVLAIIGSLAAIGLVMYGSSVDSIKTDLANVQTAEASKAGLWDRCQVRG